MFHERVGRGTAADAWPDFLLHQLSARGRRMLEVYDGATRKAQQLQALVDQPRL